MTEKSEEKNTIPFYPDHVSTEFKVTLWIIAGAVIVGIMGLLWPIGQEPPADPMNTPTHTQPEWYFLFLFQILKYVPKTTGVIIPFIAIGILILWPFLDRRVDSHQARKIRTILASIVMVIIVVLTLLGAYT
jgi:quinol-cytochrome oxidoreductase complex cytochrome b subunit